MVLLIILFSQNAQEARAQGIGIFNFTPPAGTSPATSMVICGPIASYTMRIQNASPDSAFNISATFNLEPGMYYQPNSIVPPLPENVSNLSAPVFTIDTLVPGGFVDVVFWADGDCSLADYLNTPGNEARFSANFDYTSSAGGTNNDVSTVNLPYTNSIKLPNAIVNEVNGMDTVVQLYDTYTRNFIIRQTGVNASLDSLKITLTYGAGTVVTNQRINGVPINPANLVTVSSNASETVMCYIMRAADFIAFNVGDGDGVFERTTNPTVGDIIEEFIWTEDVEIISCDNLAGQVDVEWGCDGNFCQTRSTNMGATVTPVPPSFVDNITHTFPACLSDPVVYTYFVTNNGGLVRNAQIQIATSASEAAIDPSSFQIRYGANQAYTPIVPSSTSGTGGSCSGGSGHVDNAVFNGLGNFTNGDTIYIQFTGYNCCVESCGSSPSFFRMRGRFRYNEQCSNSNRFRYDYTPTVIANPSSNSFAPSYIGGGNTETWNYSMMGFRYYDFNRIRTRGRHCIKMNIPAGLCYVPGNPITWTNRDGNITHVPTTVDTTINPDGSSVLRACFAPNLNLSNTFNSSEFYVDLTHKPGCNTGDVNVSFQAYFHYGDTCADGGCEIDYICETNPTRLPPVCCPACPGDGCVGPITLSMDFQRICFGEPDNNQDGCPDGGAAVLDFSQIRTERAMQGDAMQMTAYSRINIDSVGILGLNFLYFNLDLPNRQAIGIDNATITIYDANGGTYSCNNITGIMSNDSLSIQYILNTALIQGCGTVPAGFVYEDGDSVRLDANLLITRNNGCSIVQQILDGCFYAGWTADPLQVPV